MDGDLMMKRKRSMYSKRVDRIISAIWITKKPVYQEQNNKRKMQHKPMVRYRMLQLIENRLLRR